MSQRISVCSKQSLESPTSISFLTAILFAEAFFNPLRKESLYILLRTKSKFNRFIGRIDDWNRSTADDCQHPHPAHEAVRQWQRTLKRCARDLVRAETIVFGMNGDLPSEDLERLPFVMVADEFFSDGCQDELEEDRVHSRRRWPELARETFDSSCSREFEWDRRPIGCSSMCRRHSNRVESNILESIHGLSSDRCPVEGEGEKAQVLSLINVRWSQTGIRVKQSLQRGEVKMEVDYLWLTRTAWHIVAKETLFEVWLRKIGDCRIYLENMW